MRTPADGRVVVHQQDDGLWRWTWRSGDAELVSNEAYDSLEEARSTASEAFPDALVEAPPDEEQAGHHRARGCLRILGLLAALAVAAVAVRRRH